MSSGGQPLVDWDHLDELAGGWDQEMDAIYQEFLASVQEDLDGLAACDSTPKKARQIAHRLKGSSGNFGFTALFSTAAEIERQAKEGRVAVELITNARSQFEQSRQEVSERRGQASNSAA
ncbi:MAG: Hpt domain-containing protein [Terrimicrobiaceae bacterium]|nr:Hpt domain-containing protein [Terrimicrobiaceae bacterium]